MEMVISTHVSCNDLARHPTETQYGCFQKQWYPKSSIWIGFSIVNHPVWVTPIFGNTHFEVDVNQVPVLSLQNLGVSTKIKLSHEKKHHIAFHGILVV